MRFAITVLLLLIVLIAGPVSAAATTGATAAKVEAWFGIAFGILAFVAAIVAFVAIYLYWKKGEEKKPVRSVKARVFHDIEDDDDGEEISSTLDDVL